MGWRLRVSSMSKKSNNKKRRRNTRRREIIRTTLKQEKIRAKRKNKDPHKNKKSRRAQPMVSLPSGRNQERVQTWVKKKKKKRAKVLRGKEASVR